MKLNNNKLWEEYINFKPNKIIHRMWFNRLIKRGLTPKEIAFGDRHNYKRKQKYGEDFQYYLLKADNPYSRQWFYRLMNKGMSVDNILLMNRSENKKRIGHGKKRVNYKNVINLYLSGYAWGYISSVYSFSYGAVMQWVWKYYGGLKKLKKSRKFI